MAIVPLQTARVSNYLRSTLSLGGITGTQARLLQVENQLSTGLRLNAASDDPGNAQIAIQLQRTLERRTAYAEALSDADSRLSYVDSTLGDVTNLLQQVQTLASANVGSDVSADQRKSAASIVQSVYTQLLTLANRQHSGQYLFAGDRGSTSPYIESGGGIKFVGSGTTITNLVDDATPIDITIDGSKVFGGDASAVRGKDLKPALTPNTRLSDLRGALGNGIRSGAVTITSGTSSRTVDLSKADTVQDVLDAINATGFATATLSGEALAIAGSGPLTITEVGGNFTAADLGIKTLVAGPSSITGTSIKPKLTGLTPISALNTNAGIDLTSGIKLSNGVATFAVSFTGATTVQDILNAINSSGSGALARINDDGTGIDIANVTQGTALTVSENGSVAASNLGLRTFTTTTPLTSLNSGRGVQTAPGPDLNIIDRTGTSHPIDLDGAVNIADVLARLNAGSGGRFSASFASNTNGILLTDTSGGGGNFIVQSGNATTAAKDLGIAATVSGNIIQGTDVNPTRSAGVFDNLLQLSAALLSNDQFAITRAASGVATDLQTVTATRGVNGAKLQEIANRKDSLDTQNLATTTLLSEIKDTDYTSAIAKYELLQTTLQANYSITSKSANQSLLDFLR